jgi:hypothetical protein
LRELNARRAAVHHASQRRTMAFAPRRDAKKMAEAIVRHAQKSHAGARALRAAFYLS